MAVSVIISNFNGAKYLPRLLETLRVQREVELQIIVVDRCSTDETHSILKGFPDVEVVSEPPESGLVTGYDVGVGHARHPHLFFCNEDMWFEPDCLVQLESAIDVKNGVWAADPWQWTYDGKTWIHGGTRYQKTAKLLPNSAHPFRFNQFCEPLERGDLVAFGCAGAIMMDHNVYKKLGGWDRSFFLDREDLDLFLRAWREGWKCVSVPEARVYHAVNVSNGKSIQGGKLNVGKRRYISGCSSQLITSVKYFPAHWVAYHFCVYLAWSLYHLCSFRIEQFTWEMLALKEFALRLPSASAYRSATRAIRLQKPAQKFFSEPAFQVGAQIRQLSAQ